MIAGQLSDSSCGTLKRCLKNDLKAGKGTSSPQNTFILRELSHSLFCPVSKAYTFSVMVLSSAVKVVEYLKLQPQIREVTSV